MVLHVVNHTLHNHSIQSLSQNNGILSFCGVEMSFANSERNVNNGVVIRGPKKRLISCVEEMVLVYGHNFDPECQIENTNNGVVIQGSYTCIQ